MRFGVSGALGAALLLGLGQGASAQDGGPSVDTTRDLVAMCQMDDRAFCYGFINGAGQFYRMLVNDETLDIAPFVCPGREVSESEAVSLFLDWYAQNPDSAPEPAIDGLFRAWVAAFPCE
jgi:hypothetical protein